MKKIDESTKILALTECLLLWDYIAEHGCRKKESIIKLYEAQRLEKYTYHADCPLCDRLGCNLCPWIGEGVMRCCESGSPYVDFCFASGVAQRKAAGRAMLRFLKEIEL